MSRRPTPPLDHAISLHRQGRLREAFDAYGAILAQAPDHPVALHFSGLVLHQAGDHRAALPRLQRALTFDTGRVDAWVHLALVYQALGRTADALGAYGEATRRAPHDPAVWENQAATLLEAGRPTEAEHSARRALALDERQPGAWYNLALALQQQGRFPEALAAADRALALAPQVGGLHGLKAALEDAGGHPERARATLEAALRRNPGEPALLFQLGTLAERTGDLASAAGAFEGAMQAGDPQGAALSQLLFLRKRLADWHDLDALTARFRAGIAAGQPLLSPFCLLSDPGSRALQRQCAEAWSRAFGGDSSLETDSERGVGTARQEESRGRLTIGYLSADFHTHATALLTAGLFERHDRRRYRVVGYSTGPDDQSPLRARIEKGFDRFVDARGWTAGRLAAQIHADGIDILVDLKGHTEDARMDVLALRPAPIQASYLGYPGTTGASFIDYLIGDPVVTPLGHAADYSETLVLLPGCYQVNDRARVIGPPAARDALGLPAGATVLCCFNQTYKINPQVLDAWCEILRRAPEAVLWLMADEDGQAAGNLAREARHRGVAPERLVFARRRANDAYLGLFAHADLFIDTWPYNGHTTASDALWAGCPVLTVLGDTFAGRVAASLLKAVGLPELVAPDPGAYVDAALRLAGDPGRRQALRTHLLGEGRASRLFDVSRTARDLERAYEAMRINHSAGARAPIVLEDA